MRLHGIVCLAFLALGLPAASAAKGNPDAASRARFPLARVDATRLVLGPVRVFRSWAEAAPDFPWVVRFQDPRHVVAVAAPDGHALVWRGRDRAGYWLYHRPKGGRARRLDACHDAYQPVWSPDSRRVAYSAVDWSRRLRGLYIVDPADPRARPRLLFSSCGHLGASLAWSPDGTKLVFDYYGKLWIMNSDGIGRCLLNLSGRTGRPVGDAERVAFSRDGARLAWQPRGESRVYGMELRERRR